MQRDWIKPLIIVLIAVLVTGLGQFGLWKLYTNKTIGRYTKEKEVLESTLKSIGPLIDVYTVNAKSTPGFEVKQTDLKPMKSLQSMLNDGYILDPSAVVGKIYKIAIEPGTPLTLDLLMDEPMDNTIREKDIITNTWPVGLKIGDYIDYQITYPLGETYTVLSHLRVIAINEGTLKVNLTGTQRYFYDAALVDYFLQKEKGSMIFVDKYIEPGVQKSAAITYSIPNNIYAVMKADPNIIDKVNKSINDSIRSMITSGVSNVVPKDGTAIANGRNELKSAINGASNTYAQEQKKLADQKAWEEFEKSGEQPPAVTPEAPTTEKPAKDAPVKETPKADTKIEVEKGVVN